MVLLEMLKEVLGKEMEGRALLDLERILDMVTKDRNKTEKRLKIDLFSIKESYKNGEISRIIWIPGWHNPLYAIKKDVCKDNAPLANSLQKKGRRKRNRDRYTSERVNGDS